MQWRNDTTLPSHGLGLRPVGKSSEAFELPLGLKTPKAQNEQRFSVLPPERGQIADVVGPLAAPARMDASCADGEASERRIGEGEHARVYPNGLSGGGGPQSKTDACVLVASEPSPSDERPG